MSLFMRLSEIHDLPTLPEIVLRIQRLIMSEEGDAALLAGIIEEDPALTSKILKVANSSFYCSTTGPISSINLAITRIGFNEIGHIALAVNLVRRFSHKSTLMDYRAFWKHALTAAHFCRMIAENCCKNLFSAKDRNILFLAGLLHDIGILVYDQFFHKQFASILEYALQEETSFLIAEQAIVPKESHCEAGSALLKLWKFDEKVATAIHFHHAPENASEKFQLLAHALFVVEHYLCNSALGSFEGSMEPISPSILTNLEISNELVIELMNRAENEVDKSNLVQALDTGSTGSRFKTI